MNNYVNILQHSIDTSVHLKIFKNREDSLKSHIYESKLDKIPLSNETIYKKAKLFYIFLLYNRKTKFFFYNEMPYQYQMK